MTAFKNERKKELEDRRYFPCRLSKEGIPGTAMN